MSPYPTFEQHLDPERQPKRILSLDGGGLRGMISVGILREIETLLRERHGNDPDFRLAHYFDLIAGTSTGAIISAGLSLGMTVDEVHQHYKHLGESLFKRSPARFGFLRAKYDSNKVKEALKDVFNDTKLNSDHFQTALLIVTKRLDTGSVWPITNHPASRYFHGGSSASTYPNGEFPLWQVVRASTAAPHFFDPETIRIGKAQNGLKPVDGQFIDGGVSTANNPSLQALMTATVDGYGFKWTPGQDKLQVISVGTGKAGSEPGQPGLFKSRAAVHAVRSLATLMNDCADHVEAMMQWLSATDTARSIDREIGQVLPNLGGTPQLSYQRYNVYFEPQWWKEHLPQDKTVKELKQLEAMDKADNLHTLDEIGKLAGKTLVKAEHFRDVFDLPAVGHHA